MRRFRLLFFFVLALGAAFCLAGFARFAAESGAKDYKLGTVDSLHNIFTFRQRLSINRTAELSMARNEYENFQILLYDTRKDLNEIRVEPSDLTGIDGRSTIDSSFIQVRRVGYVPTQKPYYKTRHVGLWPDPLMPEESFDVKKRGRLVLWATVYVPENASPGKYEGFIDIQPKNASSQRVPITLTVWGFTLPKGSNLKTAFDFYPHITSTRYPKEEGESDASYRQRISKLNELYIIDMLKHRINPILNIAPLSEKDFKRVEHYLEYGLNNFSIGRKGGSFGNNWPKEDEAIEELLPLYRTYGENLKINNMLDYHYIYTWDEGKIGNPQVSAISSMIHRAHPALKNMVCYHGFWEPDKDPGWGRDIDIWCFQIEEFDEGKMRRLQESDVEVWTYVSGPGGDGSPNLVIDYDSIDYRIIPWLCWKYDIKGLLYWCVNWWSKVNPFESAANTKWAQNGNGLLYYPGAEGPIASLRLEILRDGLEDYEYLVALKNRIEGLRKKGLYVGHSDLYKKSNELLAVDRSLASSTRRFTKKGDALYRRRMEIAKAIQAIDSILDKEKNE